MKTGGCHGANSRAGLALTISAIGSYRVADKGNLHILLVEHRARAPLRGRDLHRMTRTAHLLKCRSLHHRWLRKPGRARPIDELAYQRRLVAVGQAIDHAVARGLAGEQRAAKRVGFHGDVDHVLAVRESFQAMLHRGDRIARTFDDDVDAWMADKRLPVVANVRASLSERIVQ